MPKLAVKKRRVAATVFGLIECLFLAGGIYGWVALVYILKTDGVYSHLCGNFAVDNTTDDMYTLGRNASDQPKVYPTCQAQDDRMNLAFTIGNFALQGSTLITGTLFDKFGLRVTRSCGIIVYVAGCLMLGFATVDLPALIFPGLCCFGMGGIQLLVTNMQIGNFFKRLRLPIVTVFSAAFDTSSATLLLMKIMYENGVQRLHSFVGLAVLALLLVGSSTFFILPKFKIVPRDETRPKFKRAKREDGMEEEEEACRETLEGAAKEAPNDVQSLWQCMFSLTYVLAILWQGLLQLRFYMYLGSLNVWLQLVTDNDIAQISMYTNIFSFIMMGGLLMGPLEGFILAVEARRLKTENMTYWRKLKTAAVPEFLCCAFGLVLSVCSLFAIKEFLYVQFVTMTAMRSFLYGLNAAFIFLAFPAEHFGKLFGFLMTFNAFTASTQYGLFKWSEGPPRDPFPVNVFLLVLVVVSFVQPAYLWFAERMSCLHPRVRGSNGTT